MIIWLDAQLPPALAPWLAERFGVTVVAVRDLDLRDATDREIFAAAREAGAVVVTKDRDFPALLVQYGPPPQIIWLTCGNTTNARLREIFEAVFPQAMQLVLDGEALIEVADIPS